MKTQAESAADRINHEFVRRMLAGEHSTTEELVDWVQQQGPVGNRAGFALPYPRPFVVETLEYDDGSHLDVLDAGAVFAW